MNAIGHQAQAGAQCPHLADYDPLSPAYLADPDAVWRSLRPKTPIFFSPAQNAYVVTRYADACQVLADTETFSSSKWLVPIRPNPPEVDAVLAQGFAQEELGAMIMLDSPRHSELRKPLAPMFTSRRVAAFEPDICSLANQLIDDFPAGGVEFVSSFAYPLPLGVVLRLLGIPKEDSAKLRAWVNRRVALMWGDLGLEEHIAAAEAFIDFQRYLQDLLEDRRRQPRDDLISDFAVQGVEEGRPLKDSEIIGQMIGFISAGHETTTSALTFMVFNLLKDRSRWEALGEDPKAMGPMIEEAIRFQGPSMSVWRTATRDAEVGGVLIPAGSRVSVLLGSANRDDEAFDAPDDFDPAAVRTRPHLGFGRGVHFCLGASLARLEIRIALEELSRRIPSLRLPDGEQIKLYTNATLRLPQTLHLTWDT
jgi:cytochrome P450